MWKSVDAVDVVTPYGLKDEQQEMNKINLVMFVNAFPDRKAKNKSMFNLYAARELSRRLNLQVIVPRAWHPGRKLLESSSYENISVITVTAPQIPGWDQFNLILYDLFIRSKIKSILQFADIIHSVGVDFAGLLCGKWAKQIQKHHVTQFIADTSRLNSDFTKYPFFTTLKSHLHGVSCNSYALSEIARKLFPNVQNIKTIHRGVDLERFSSIGQQKGPLRNLSPVRFLFFGGLPMYPDRFHNMNTKGGMTLMKAWQEAEKDPDFKKAFLFFAGPNAINRQSIQWKESLLCPEQVILSDSIPYDDVPAFIRSSDIVLIPSMDEGLPNLAFEASACSRTVFGSNIGGISDVIVDGKTGFLLKAGDVSEWKKKLIAYSNVDQITKIRELGEKAREHMESCFDYKKFSVQLIDLYKNVLQNPI